MKKIKSNWHWRMPENHCFYPALSQFWKFLSFWKEITAFHILVGIAERTPLCKFLSGRLLQQQRLLWPWHEIFLFPKFTFRISDPSILSFSLHCSCIKSRSGELLRNKFIHQDILGNKMLKTFCLPWRKGRGSIRDNHTSEQRLTVNPDNQQIY